MVTPTIQCINQLYRTVLPSLPLSANRRMAKSGHASRRVWQERLNSLSGIWFWGTILGVFYCGLGRSHEKLYLFITPMVVQNGQQEIYSALKLYIVYWAETGLGAQYLVLSTHHR